MLDTQRFSWVNDQTRYGGFTLAIIDGIAEDDVVRLYGGDPGEYQIMTFDESFNMCDETSPCFVRTLTTLTRVRVDGDQVEKDTAVIAMENNGWAAKDAARTADKGRHFVVYRGGQGQTLVVHTVDGQLVADFEPALMVDGIDVNGTIPAWVNEVDWSWDNIAAAALALAADVMKVDVTEDWFTMPCRTTVIAPP
ncbi:hypothetical protein [Actinokineospora sp.]|uniref:hypothetical protein n=1 Tax=Actinokineospora sp. TaxID=1872133 RepID=UPI0040376335